MAEQFVAQQIYLGHGQNTRPENYFWLRDQTAGKAEIDFLTVKNNKFIPIEIKAGKSGFLKALLLFMAEKKKTTNLDFAIRYDLAYRKNLMQHPSRRMSRF